MEPDGPGVAAPLPSGTVTFLFTDLAESTRLWEADPSRMAEAVAAHHALLAEVVTHHEGLVVKTTGDGVMAVFEEPSNAVRAAVAAQLGFAEAVWSVPMSVRMGLHTGVAHANDGDYHAPAVNRAARIASVAHPDQILVSDATAALVEDVELRDRGPHELRGLSPMRLHQVLAPGLPAEFPLSDASVASRLPSAATSFVGRDHEMQTIIDLVRHHRLVTLSGAGGCGKTRLAIEAGAIMAHEFTDGVRFVDLAPVSQETGVDDTVAEALGMPTGPNALPARQRVIAHLSDRSILVILDNCEHLLDPCADLVTALLATAGDCRIVATSREALDVESEHVLRVPSLDPMTDALTLFIDRATASHADFEVSGTSLDETVRICQRLDGIPLAIELAAARTSHLSTAQILERLDDRFRLLTGGRRRIRRQQTLAATLDWSHDLLDDDDREVLRRLAAFPASFTLEAAEAVVARADVLDRLGSLVAKSLVHTVRDGSEVRYRLLESVRLYGEDKLLDAGEADATRTRHLRWIAEWLEDKPLELRLFGNDDVISTEKAGILTAIEWAIATEQFETAAAVASGVDWSRTEGWPEAFELCTRLLAEPSVSHENQVRLALMLWWLAPIQRWAYKMARANPTIEQAHGDDGPLGALAMAASARDLIIPAVRENDDRMRDRTIELAERAVARAAEATTPWRIYCRLLAGFAYASFVQPEQAIEHFAAERTNDPRYSTLDSTMVAYHALMEFVLGNHTEAGALARASFSPGLVPYWSHARPLCLVALAADGDMAEARRALHDYAAKARDAYWILGKESAVILGGVLAGVEGNWPLASRLLSAGSAGMSRTPADSILYVTFRDRARAQLGTDHARACRDDGRAMTIDEAFALALA